MESVLERHCPHVRGSTWKRPSPRLSDAGTAIMVDGAEDEDEDEEEVETEQRLGDATDTGEGKSKLVREIQEEQRAAAAKKTSGL